MGLIAREQDSVCSLFRFYGARVGAEECLCFSPWRKSEVVML
jgi:hypothetical protein